MRIGTIAICLLLAGNVVAQTEQHDHHGEAAERLGTVSFLTSCNAEAQTRFTRAVALLHSFWYEESGKVFVEIQKQDPKCAIERSA